MVCIRILTILLLFCFTVTGCSEETLTIEGYILEVEERRVLVAQGVTGERYMEIKDKTLSKLDEERISLIYLSYDKSSSLSSGNRVEVWIEGGIDESFPAKARAKKIEVMN